MRATEGGGKEARVAHERKKTKTNTKRKETEKEEINGCGKCAQRVGAR